MKINGTKAIVWIHPQINIYLLSHWRSSKAIKRDQRNKTVFCYLLKSSISRRNKKIKKRPKVIPLSKEWRQCLDIIKSNENSFYFLDICYRRHEEVFRSIKAASIFSHRRYIDIPVKMTSAYSTLTRSLVLLMGHILN